MSGCDGVRKPTCEGVPIEGEVLLETPFNGVGFEDSAVELLPPFTRLGSKEGTEAIPKGKGSMRKRCSMGVGEVS